MKFERSNTHRNDARIFRFILNDYFASRDRQLISVLSSLEQEVARWLHRVGGMAGEW